MTSDAETVEEYLESLPDNRREAITKVRGVILKNLPKEMDEVMRWGMITYEVPLEITGETYNGKPLMYAALASQKNHMAIYLSGIYASEENTNWFEEEYLKTGKKMDKGKSCVRFKTLDNLPLDLIGKTIGKMTTKEFVDMYENARHSRKR